ncbi:MAG: hypothetical protein GY761_11305 [Hyphomicrobiales bacterium]|nr:hypothetical protein [Hyphomicrobiales bacterium]
MTRYQTALNREDISHWLVHFTKPSNIGHSPFQVLYNIINSQEIAVSRHQAITKYHPEGAVCFYDVPPRYWDELIKTNPNGRQPYGVIVSKAAFWQRGGRPAIYTENPGNPSWPKNERFRLITTALNGVNPIDWTHEREWRTPMNLSLDLQSAWWWPCVAKISDALAMFRDFNAGNQGVNVIINQIYIVELRRVLSRNEIL